MEFKSEEMTESVYPSRCSTRCVIVAGRTAHLNWESRIFVPISLDSIEIKTSDRLAGVRALLSVLEDGISEYERRKRAELGEFDQSTREGLAEYSVNREILEYEAEYRLPRFAAYAVVTILHTILEVHLRECANEAMKGKGLQFSPGDLKGSGIEASGKYLTKSGVCNLEDDGAWSRMKHLRDLRNLIVHGAGTPSEQNKKTVNRLKQEFKKGFGYSGESWQWNEIWISPELCRQLTDDVEKFAKACLLAVRAVGPS